MSEFSQIDSPKYQSCLGTAAEVDRKELPYLLIYKGDGQHHAHLCVKSKAEHISFIISGIQGIGGHIASNIEESEPHPMHNMGFTRDIQDLITGMSAVVMTIIDKLPHAEARAFIEMTALTVIKAKEQKFGEDNDDKA
jgi:hypothetical protein